MENLRRIYNELINFNPLHYSLNFSEVIDSFIAHLESVKTGTPHKEINLKRKHISKAEEYLLGAHKIKEICLFQGEILYPNDYVYGYYNLSFEEFCSYIFWRTLIRKRQTQEMPDGFLALYLIEIVNFVEVSDFESGYEILNYLESLCENFENANFRQISKAKKEFVLLYGTEQVSKNILSFSEYDYLFESELISNRKHPNLYKALIPASTSKSKFFLDNEDFLCKTFPEFFYRTIEFLSEKNIKILDLYKIKLQLSSMSPTYVKQIFSEKVVNKTISLNGFCLYKADSNGLKSALCCTVAPDNYLIRTYVKKYILRLFEKHMREKLGYPKVKITTKEIEDMTNRSSECQRIYDVFSSNEFMEIISEFFA